ncbi:MAG: CapA family protein [Thermomicrobiales bacterium]|nr:CapA family protein [Thermomicrobiales bacterium]
MDLRPDSSDNPEPDAGPPASHHARRIDRRALIASAAMVAAVGVGVARRFGERGEPAALAEPATPRPATPAAARASESMRPALAHPATPVATPAATPFAATPAPIRPASALRAGYVLAASPRLPLAGIGPDDADRLLAGEIRDWRRVGCPVSLPVEMLGLAGVGIRTTSDMEMFADYDALAAALWSRPGAVALAPVEMVDFRAQTLSVGGIDPLRSGEAIEPAISIGVIGDVVPGRNVHQKMVAYGDFLRPFRRVASLLARFDLTVANLEGNLSATIPQPADPHSFSFVSDPAMLDGFALAGIDAVTLANNHTVWNEEGWGVQALLDTIDALDGAGLPYFGAGVDLERARAPWIATVGGISLAWLGIDGVTANHEIEPGAARGVVDFDAGATADRPGTNPYLSAQFLADIAAAAERAQIVIPYFHMGAEYIEIPPDWVVSGARSAIDAGAGMVVTNHPHVVQGMEIYNGRPIVYSPGNFIIDQMWGVEVRSGHALETLWRDGAIVGLRIHPTEIEDFHQPRLMTTGERANLLDRFWSSVDRLAARE